LASFCETLAFRLKAKFAQKTWIAKQLLKMAAIAPCAHYGCGCGHVSHLRNFCSSGTMQQGVSMSSRLRRLFLELKPPQQKHWEAQQLVQQCPPQEVGPFVKAILDQPAPLRWMHILSVEMLGKLLRVHPAAVVTHPLFFACFCGTNNPWDKAQSTKPPNLH